MKTPSTWFRRTPSGPLTRRGVTRRLIGGLLIGLGVAGGSLAMAAWTSSGTGNGYAKADTMAAITIGDSSASAAATLYPGATGDVSIKVTNPNAFGVRVTTVTRTGAITSDKGGACDASTGVTFTDQTGLSAAVAAGATTTITLSGAAAMSSASDNSCQGAVFTIPVSVSARVP